MGNSVVLIVDLSDDIPMGFSKLDLDDKISIICASVIGSILNKSIKNQISILSARSGLVEQISHFSGDRNHHFQGLQRLLGLKKKNGIVLETCFLLAIRLLETCNNQNQKQILFLNKGPIDKSFCHNICANLIKNQIYFSVISFQSKTFFLELLTRISNGEYFSPSSYSKKEIFYFLERIVVKKEIKSSLIFCGEVQVEFFPNFNLKTKIKNCNLRKLRFFCPYCKFLIRNPKKPRCSICGAIFLDRFQKKGGNFDLLISLQKQKFFTFIFSTVNCSLKITDLNLGRFNKRNCYTPSLDLKFSKKKSLFSNIGLGKEVYSSIGKKINFF